MMTMQKIQPTSALECQLYTQAEAAKILGVCPKTIYNLTKSGALRAIRVMGRTIRYRLSDLDEFSKRRTQIA